MVFNESDIPKSIQKKYITMFGIVIENDLMEFVVQLEKKIL